MPTEIGPFIFDPFNCFFAMLLWLQWNRSITLSYGFLNVNASKEDFSNNSSNVDVIFLDAHFSYIVNGLD